MEDVVEFYLKPIGMEYMEQAFIGGQINGGRLLALEEYEVIQLGCHVTGDRKLFMEYLQIIRKKYSDPSMKPIAAQWVGHTPVTGCVYHQDCCHCCAFVCCACFIRKIKWEVTKEGIKWTKRLAACQCCGVGKNVVRCMYQCACMSIYNIMCIFYCGTQNIYTRFYSVRLCIVKGFALHYGTIFGIP